MSEKDDKERKSISGKTFESNGNVGLLDYIWNSYHADNLTSVKGSFRTSSSKRYIENSLKHHLGAYQGQILQINKIKAGDSKSNNFDLQFIKELKPDTIIISYKVRIPYKDGMIPRTSFSPNKKNSYVHELYVDVFPRNTNEEYNVGDYVEVEFDNYITLEGGRIISTFGNNYQSTNLSTETQTSAANLNFDNKNDQGIFSTENSLAGYTPGKTPVFYLKRQAGKDAAIKRSGIPKNINYVIADIPASANEFSGPLAGKDRQALMVRIPAECSDGENHFLFSRARDQLAKMNQDFNKWSITNKCNIKNIQCNESIRSFQDQIDIWNTKYTPRYEELVAKGSKFVKDVDYKQISKTSAALPGYSDHQPGMAIDIIGTNGSGEKFSVGNGCLYDWLIENGWKYGWYRTVSMESWHFDFREQWIGVPPPAGYGKTTVKRTEKNSKDTPTGL